ncbi:MAG: type II and III secretion system protein [Balneolaceae bacterium]|nr:type II and III secretion system protein [Balneolaceae bacterium]
MKLFILLIFPALLLLTDLSDLQAQDRMPREYTNPDEVISFDRRTSFQEAIDVINTFAQEYEDRFIIDRTGYTGEIGVSLPAMHWRDALDYILRMQDFVALESPDVYELVPRSEVDREERPDGRPAATTDRDELELKINTGTREVRINATFFEGNRRALREIGVDWSTLTNAVPSNIGQFVGEGTGGGGGGGQGQIPTTEFAGGFVNVNARGAQSVSQNVFNSLINFGDVGGIEVQALFSAFEADNLGKILATPSIKVINGEEGRIQVGEDFSIKQRDFAGNVTDQFFSTGTILRVTPQIVEYADTTLIYLDLEAERSSAQPDPVSTIVSRQQANTHALLLDGESTVIAGLYRTEEAQVRRGIPILKDLPGWFFGLKYLFGFNSTDVQENELIILLQAELEEPIPTRLARGFNTQREILESAQELHRTRLDLESPRAPDIALEPTLPSAPFDEEDAPVGESIVETDRDLERAEEQERQRRAAEREEVDVAALRAEMERRQLTVADVRQRELRHEWREMEMENMNDDSPDYEFYVIGGSFTVERNADRLFRSFVDEGLDAHMLYNPATGYYFVAYKGFHSANEAMPYLRDIQADRQSEAWLSRVIRETRLDWE